LAAAIMIVRIALEGEHEEEKEVALFRAIFDIAAAYQLTTTTYIDDKMSVDPAKCTRQKWNTRFRFQLELAHNIYF
jgi:hypothetical protein